MFSQKKDHFKNANKANVKTNRDSDYENAKERLLNNVVPDEKVKGPSCLWRLCCCCYYLFCCHCCFEKNKSVKK